MGEFEKKKQTKQQQQKQKECLRIIHSDYHIRLIMTIYLEKAEKQWDKEIKNTR